MKAEYKSAVRSRTLIKRAFLELLREKSIDKITVTDIVARADINRGTFYAHYDDIDSLRKAVWEDIENELYDALGYMKKAGSQGSPLGIFMNLSAFLEKDKSLYASILGLGIAHSLLDRLQNSFVSFVRNIDTIDDSIKNSADFKARSYFFAGGVISLYSAWLRGEISGDGANIANIAGDLIMQSTLLFK